jgi:hypothetical protein
VTKKLRFTVNTNDLRERGQRKCEEVIKFFVTNQPTSFSILEMRKIIIGDAARLLADSSCVESLAKLQGLCPIYPLHVSEAIHITVLSWRSGQKSISGSLPL